MSLFDLIKHPIYPEFYDICKNTGTLFYKKAKQREYKNSYFMEEYKNQYNKTYYEDEQNLRSLAFKRLTILNKFTEYKNKSILEIGSAAGFFLDEAKKFGLDVEGIEISKTEVDYSKSKLKLNVHSISFLDFETEKKFSCVAMFFVLEHFKEQEKILEKIFSILDESGFILLSIPSAYGPSFKSNTEEWFSSHPEDHFVDYTPKSIRKTLKFFGAEIIYMEPMSYHPHRERGFLGKFPLKYFYKEIAKWKCYGDTIFLIAQRRRT